MNSQDYWDERIEKHMRDNIKTEKQIEKKLLENYKRAFAEAQKEIDAYYGRYATKEGITGADARKLASEFHVEQFKDKAKRYVKERNFTAQANAEMRLYNLTTKVSRVELLKQQIRLEIIAMTSDNERLIDDSIEVAKRREYETQAGAMKDFVGKNADHLKSVVNKSHETAQWATILWGVHQSNLRSEVDRLVNIGIVNGRNPRVLARELRKAFDSNVYTSERLMRTELANAQGDVALDTLKSGDFEKYKYNAEPSACKICQKLNGRTFKIKDAKVGTNMFPMHPNCKCSISGYTNARTS